MKIKKNIIVTGGAGFIGSHLSNRLISEGFDVTILDNLSTGRKENIPKTADFIKIDLTEEKNYYKLKKVRGMAIFHLAGQSSGEASFKYPSYDLRSHVMSTFYLLELCKRKKISRFIYSSSMGVYGDPKYFPINEYHPLNPKTFYAAAKISAESYIRLYHTLGINTTILRLFNVFGPGQNLDNKMQGMVSIYLSYFLEGMPVLIKGSGERFRDFVYIDDVVDAWLRIFKNPISYGKTYNVGSGRKTKVKDLIRLMKNMFGFPDYPIEYKSGTPGDQFGAVADIKLIEKELKWSPKIDLNAGLKKMIDFEKGKLIYG